MNLGITATAAELNKLDGVTATASEINKLDGLTATTAELNYVDGVTSNIQTQLNGKSSKTQAIPYIVGNSTDTTAGTWTGTCDAITAYEDGLTIIFVPQVAGASTTTLNINGLGAKTCYYTNTSKMTTHYAVNTPIILTYIGGVWKRADYDSNTNTQVRVYRQTSGYDADYPILVSRAQTSSIGTAGSNNTYTGVYGVIGQDGDNTPTINPHTGALKAYSFTGIGSGLTSLNASNISSGTLPINRGGTGATTAAAALTNLGITATVTELNKLDGVTATTTELNYVDGVTSNIQTQLNGKAASSHGTHVTYSTTAPVVAGTASVGTATTVSRSDHVHPAQTTVSGNAGSATKLATTRYIDGVSFNGSANVTRYATCSTAAGTVAKTASITAGTFSLITGARVTVKFTYANTVASPTLNVGSTGAKAIYWHGAALASSQYWQAGAVLDFVYNGTQWELIGIAKDNNTTYSNASLGQGYGTCSTAAATVAKVATLSNYALTTGGIIAVKFSYDVPASATLNINSKGAKPIYHQGVAIVDGVIKAGNTATFVYNGSQYHLISNDSAVRQTSGKQRISFTVPASGWAQSTTGRYTQTVANNMITANTNGYHADIDMSIVTEDTYHETIEAWALIDNIETIDGGIKLTSFTEAPTVDLNIIIDLETTTTDVLNAQGVSF